MKQKKFAGLIECRDTILGTWGEGPNGFDGFHLKKVLIKQHTGTYNREYYPNAEIVADKNAIMNDHTIELVIVSGPCESDMNLVAEAIGAGKQVRVL